MIQGADGSIPRGAKYRNQFKSSGGTWMDTGQYSRWKWVSRVKMRLTRMALYDQRITHLPER